MLRRVNNIKAASEDGDCAAARMDGGAVGDSVYTAGKAAYDADAVRGELVCDLFRDLAAIRGWSAGANDGDGPLIDRGEIATDVEDGRRVINFLEERGVGIVVPSESADAMLSELLDFRIGVDSRPLSGNRTDDAIFEAGGAQV